MRLLILKHLSSRSNRLCGGGSTISSTRMPAKPLRDYSVLSTSGSEDTLPIEGKATGLDGRNIQTAGCTQWGCPILRAACLSIKEPLRMVHDEDCRTAVFGKTERTVGLEGDDEPDTTKLMRHCTEKSAETDRLSLTLLSHSFTLESFLAFLSVKFRRVGTRCHHQARLSELRVQVSLHAAQALIKVSLFFDTSSFRIARFAACIDRWQFGCMSIRLLYRCVPPLA